MLTKLPYQHKIEIQAADIDDLGHVNNVVYVRWVQEVAAAHWEYAATSDLKSRYAWVVLRHEKVLAEAKTTWCLLDAKSFKPIRIPGEILELL